MLLSGGTVRIQVFHLEFNESIFFVYSEIESLRLLQLIDHPLLEVKEGREGMLGSLVLRQIPLYQIVDLIDS